jgi:hypothetical protein
MTDAQIARALKLTVEEVRQLCAHERAAYERLLLAELGVKTWLAGEGPKPAGVIICDARSRPGRGAR